MFFCGILDLDFGFSPHVFVKHLLGTGLNTVDDFFEAIRLFGSNDGFIVEIYIKGFGLNLPVPVVFEDSPAVVFRVLPGVIFEDVRAAVFEDLTAVDFKNVPSVDSEYLSTAVSDDLPAVFSQDLTFADSDDLPSVFSPDLSTNISHDLPAAASEDLTVDIVLVIDARLLLADTNEFSDFILV